MKPLLFVEYLKIETKGGVSRGYARVLKFINKSPAVIDSVDGLEFDISIKDIDIDYLKIAISSHYGPELSIDHVSLSEETYNDAVRNHFTHYSDIPGYVLYKVVDSTTVQLIEFPIYNDSKIITVKTAGYGLITTWYEFLSALRDQLGHSFTLFDTGLSHTVMNNISRGSSFTSYGPEDNRPENLYVLKEDPRARTVG